MRQTVLTLLLLLAASIINLSIAQSLGADGGIKLTGQIRNIDDGDPVPFVHIVNENSQQGSSSDMDGNFTIKVAAHDTLLFSAVGFEKFLFIISKEQAKKGFNRIYLTPATYELDQVDVFAFKDASALKRHILSMDLPEENKDKIHIPGSYDGPKKPAKPGVDFSNGIGFSGPISLIQNAFSKKAKEERKYLQVQQDYQKQKLVDAKFNRKVVQEITGLQDEVLDEFMIFCNRKITDTFILASNEYEITLAVNKCYDDFVKIGN